MTIVLGFATSLVYGFADFFGALASRKLNAMLVTLVSGFSGLVFLISMTPFFGMKFDSSSIFWGALAGVISAVAITALYASLAIGPISILSPLGAIMSALVPMTFGLLFQGESFSAVGIFALVGIVIAVGLVGFIPGADLRLPSPKGLALGLTAGISIGLLLICIDQAPADSGLTPVIFLRLFSMVGIGIMLLVSLARGTRITGIGVTGKTWQATVLAGVLDSSANVLFLTAMRLGELSVVSVLTALYPLGTIVLARIFLKEKIAKVQLAGVLLALSCSALLASGL
ncbi:MAG: EamA family transporter [Micrococcales bacterium]